MTLSKLSIFSKKTDANEVVKGYEYQRLRTLENWLSNKVHNCDEIIYCEYEDDIFERNINAGVSKFTQIKLYGSKPFSFKSEEITKAITNFFMLFVKGEYSFDSVEFVFETNTGIAGKYGDNDAILLKYWFENQTSIDAILLKKITEKVKSIVVKYINEELPKAQKISKEAAESAMIDFNSLPDSVWEDFVKSIKWIFNDVSPDDAVEQVVSSIKKYIKKLSFPAIAGKIDTVFTTLYYEVSVKMFQNTPEKRCLTIHRMDGLILDLGDEADKQYNIALEAWKDTGEIKYFNLAEFLEVLYSARHCRESAYLKTHSVIWQKLLSKFIHFAQTPDRYRHMAVYEFLWGSLRPIPRRKPQGTLFGCNELIELYFAESGKFDDHESVEDSLYLLHIIRFSIGFDKSDLDISKTEKWLKDIEEVINVKLQQKHGPNERCYWLELRAAFYSTNLDFTQEVLESNIVFDTYDELLELLPRVALYNVTRLSNILNEALKQLLRAEASRDYIEKLEGIADKLMPFVSQRNGNYQYAKTYVERGANYLNSTNLSDISRALNYFHKAKDMFFQEETKEGYVLSLLNISQLYAALNMNFAAKYYALSAAWFSINNNPEKLVKKITDAFGMLVHYDFTQGSWIHALEIFEFFVRVRVNFDPRSLEELDEILGKSFITVAGILTMAPKISLELNGFIESQKYQMSDFFAHYMEPLIKGYEQIIQDRGLKAHLENKLSSPPINDIGEVRKIEFKALGSLWIISFPNTWHSNALGEEFTAVLQVLLVELATAKKDLHFVRNNIEIEIVEADKSKQPQQYASNQSFKWTVYTCTVDLPGADKITMQSSSVIQSIKYVLRDLSMIKDDEVFNFIDGLYKNESLAGKTLTNDLYQRIYRNVYSEESFKESMRNLFSGNGFEIKYKESKVLRWNDTISPLYQKEESLKQIESRYKSSIKSLYLTIEKLKKQDGYNSWLSSLRDHGWLDWQILMGMYNHAISNKTSRFMSGMTFQSESERQEAFDTNFHKLRRKDESEIYVDFPLDYFQGEVFQFQLDQTVFLVLKALNLENRSRFPNFPAFKDFLDHRFNFAVDDLEGFSPL